MPKPWEEYQKRNISDGPWTQYQPDFSAPKDAAVQTARLGDRGQAALESFGNVATLGYLPQIQAGIEGLLPDPGAAQKAEMETQGFRIQEKPQDYITRRDINIRRQKAQAEEFPVESIGGGLLGAVATAPLAAKAIPTAGKLGTGLLARLGEAGLSGAATGAVINPGDIEGEINLIQPEARLKGAGVGGILGVAGQGLAEGASRLAQGIQAAPESLKKTAGEKAFKAVGPYQKDVLRNQQRIDDIGKTLLEKKVVKTLPASYNKLAQRANQALEETGQQFDDMLNKIADASENYVKTGTLPIVKGAKAPTQLAGVDRRSVAQSIRDELFDQSGLPGSTQRNEFFNKLLGEFEAGGGLLSVKDAQKMKEAAGKQINWKRLPSADMPDTEKFYRSLYSKLRQGVEDAAEALSDVLGKDAKDKFIKVKQEYGALKEAAKIANERSGREFANRYLSLSDYQSGQMGGAVGALSAIARGESATKVVLDTVIGNMIGAFTNKGFRRFGNQVSAQTALKTANLLAKRPDLLQRFEKQIIAVANKNPDQIANALVRLAKDPQFIRAQEGEK